MADPAADPTPDAEQLIAERDALRAELEQMKKPRRPGRLRQVFVGVLVLFACIVFVAAVPAVWARRNFLDTDRFVSRVAPVIDDPAVQEALTFRLTEQIMTLLDPRALFEEALPERGQILAVPLTNAVEGFVQDRVAAFVGSDQFAQLWETATRAAHTAAVRVLEGKSEVLVTEDGRVTLNLLPVVYQVIDDINATSPEIFGRSFTLPTITADDLPDVAIERLETALGVDLGPEFGQFTVYDENRLEPVQDAVHLFDRLVVWLLPIAILLAAAALWISGRRRRTLLQLAAGVALGMVLLRRVVFRLDDDIAALPPTQQGRAATRVGVDAFLDPLLTFTVWTLVVAAVVAGVALVTADYAWARSLRARASVLWGQLVSTTRARGRDEQTVAWIRQHRDALLAAGAIIGFFVLWAADLSWLGLLVVLGIVVAYEIVVYRIAAAPPGQPEEPAPPGTSPASTGA